jgi:hypothetical protein
VAEEINEPSDMAESRRYDALRPRLMQMNRQTQWAEMRRMGASPDYAVGSVHAVTEQGEVFVASASGSQLAAGSGVNKVLIVNCEFTPGRITVILVKQELGF